MAEIGHNGINGAAATALRSFFQRITRIEEEIAGLNADKSEIYSELKAQGFDPKIMRIVMNRQKQDREAVAELDELIQLYENALRVDLPDGAEG